LAQTSTRILLLALVIFIALTAVMTYPQVLHLRDGVHDEGDPLLNTWALAWVAHQLPRAPAHLFDANIFAPERRTLAFSETLVAPGLIAAPLQWLGAGPLLVSNLVLLSGFVVSGAGVALLVATLTGQAGAGILAGIVFSFLPYRFENYPQLQLQQTQFLPFAMWAFHRLLARGRLRDGAWLGVFTAGQVLSCTYYGLFLLPYMTLVCGTMLIADRTMQRSRVAALLLAAAIVVVAVLPVVGAYAGARQAVGERGSGEVAAGSATPGNYLAASSGSVLYGRVFERFAAPERRLFPGFVAVGLAIVGLIFAPLKGARYRVAYGLGLLLAFDVSLGFNGFTYRVLYAYVVPFRAVRVPARMGIFVGFSLAVLAGFGVAAITDRVRGVNARRGLLVTLAALMLAEYASKPMDIEVMPLGPPPAYADILRDKGDGPTATLFEFPISPGDDSTYMYYSIFHWQRLVNGYSGFFPASYEAAVSAVRRFPDEASMSAIKAHQTRYLVIHGERLQGARYETLIPDLDKRADLALLSRTPAARPGQHGEISVYRVLY
jgi:hypothetical protein